MLHFSSGMLQLFPNLLQLSSVLSLHVGILEELGVVVSVNNPLIRNLCIFLEQIAFGWLRIAVPIPTFKNKEEYFWYIKSVVVENDANEQNIFFIKNYAHIGKMGVNY